MFGILDPRLMGSAQQFQQPGGLLSMAGNGYPMGGPMPNAPMPQQMPQQPAQMPQAGQGGILSGLRGMMAPETMLPVAAQLMGNQGNAANFGNAMMAMGQGIGDRKQKNKTLEYLRRTDPELAEMVEATGMSVKDAWEIGQQRAKAQMPNYTDDQREYQMARQQGFDGSFMDYQVKMKEAGRQQVNIDTGVKLPSGYRWKNPEDQNAGVEPIPGGPGEQIPGELAARVGMADNFLKQIPSIRARVQAGDATGPIDRTLGGLGIGSTGTLYQEIDSGADVLQRLLTGAGMPASEAAEYARRYKPTYADNVETMTAKLDRLEQELIATRNMAMRGRGEAGGPPANDGWQEVGPGVRIRQVK